MAMDYEEAKTLIVESLTKKLKSKSKFYFNDLSKDGVLEYWSSGSTSMYGLPGTGKQASAEHED